MCAFYDRVSQNFLWNTVRVERRKSLIIFPDGESLFRRLAFNLKALTCIVLQMISMYLNRIWFWTSLWNFHWKILKIAQFMASSNLETHAAKLRADSCWRETRGGVNKVSLYTSHLCRNEIIKSNIALTIFV